VIDETTPKGKLIAAAMRLAAEKPWRDVTLAEISATAGVSLVDLKATFSTKGEIVAAFIAAVDDEMLRRAPARVDGTSPRDVLFEVVMSRFDVLQPYKAAVHSILRDVSPDPALIRAGLAANHWMLVAAGISTDGAGGAVRLAGLASLYASVARTWLDDDDPGLARTMAALDRRLRRGERTLSTIDSVLDALRSLTRHGNRRTRPSRTPPRDAGTAAGEPPSPSI
jgi:AcrR family transcriptional regulator